MNRKKRGSSAQSNYSQRSGRGQRRFDQDYEGSYGSDYGRNQGRNYGDDFGGSEEYRDEGIRNYDQGFDEGRESRQWGDSSYPPYEGRYRSGSYGQGYFRDKGYEDDYQSSNRNIFHQQGLGNREYGSDYGRGERYSGFERGGYGGSRYNPQRWSRSSGLGGSQSGWEDSGQQSSGWGGPETYSSDWGSEFRNERQGQESKFRGKGPKGYKRSDERIQEEINDMLTDEGALDASEIEVRVENGEVTLSGTVTQKRDKRLAEEIAESISGVSNVANHLRVNKESTSESEKTFTSREPLSDFGKKRQKNESFN